MKIQLGQLRELIREIVAKNDNGNTNKNCKDCIECDACNHCIGCRKCVECIDCLFCISCKFCSNCIECSGQHGQSYMIRNKQYSQKEYLQLAKKEWETAKKFHGSL